MRFVCLSCDRYYDDHIGQCSYCFRVGQIVPVPYRASSSIDELPEVATADELARSAWDEVRSATYPTLRLGRRAMVLISGAEGSGKTTFLARLLDGIAGPVALVSGEMGVGPSLAALLGRLGIRRAGFHCVGRAGVGWTHEYVCGVRAVALGLDSVQALTLEPADVRHFLATSPLRLAAVVSQLNKAGEPAGRREWAHECDVHVEVADGMWRLAKSRYQQVAGVHGAVMEAKNVA